MTNNVLDFFYDINNPYCLDVPDEAKNIYWSDTLIYGLNIILKSNPVSGFKHLSYLGILERILPELEECRYVIQDKRNTLNVYQHTMKVLDLCPKDDLNILWCALFHDIGKYSQDFRKHPNISAEIFVKYMDIVFQNSDVSLELFEETYGFSYNKVLTMILYHMYPFYALNDKQTREHFKKRKYAVDMTRFAILDKSASNPEYVDGLYDLIDEIKDES